MRVWCADLVVEMTHADHGPVWSAELTSGKRWWVVTTPTGFIDVSTSQGIGRPRLSKEAAIMQAQAIYAARTQ